jgi:hypothetical protein
VTSVKSGVGWNNPTEERAEDTGMGGQRSSAGGGRSSAASVNLKQKCTLKDLRDEKGLKGMV